MKTLLQTKTNQWGFSLMELLGIVMVVGILAGSGYAVFSNISETAKEQKLTTEIATLNSAVSSYLGFGGNLDDVESPEDVIAHLRSVANSEEAHRIPGLSSSMVDPRIAIRVINEEDEDQDRGKVRVVWNADKKVFETATAGAGITSFYLDDNQAETERTEEDRNFAFLYAKKDTWVWDYADNAPAAPVGPTRVATADPTTINNLNPPTIINPPNTGPEGTPLAAPQFSIPGSNYPIRDYDLSVTLTNPNPAGSSDVFYQIDFGTWQRYTPGSVLEVEPGSNIAAQTIARNNDWLDSSRANEAYEADPVQLNPPRIRASASEFGVFTDRLVAVVLQNTNGDDPHTIQYRIGSGPWADYDEFLLLDRADFENGATIMARSYSEHPYYLTSETDFQLVTAQPLELGSVSEGFFERPEGQNGMVTNLPYNNSSNNYFEWGRITDNYGNYYNGQSKSSLEFEGFANQSVSSGSRFQVGNIDYYNGTFLADTGADAVNLALDLAFDIGGVNYNSVFDYEFELVNTLNDNNNLTGWSSADFVRINQGNSNATFEINGLTFELVLEFGETTADGFSDFDEFHVREQRGATSNVYATLYDRTQSQGSVGSDGQNTGTVNSNGSIAGFLNGIQDFLGSLGNDDNDGGKGKGKSDDDKGKGKGDDDDKGKGKGKGKG